MDCYLALTGGKILFIPIAIGIKRFGRKAGKWNILEPSLSLLKKNNIR